MTVEESWTKAKQMAGTPPTQPELRDVVNTDTGDLGGTLGGGSSDNHIQTTQADSNNVLLVRQYEIELTAYNARLQMIFDALLKEKS